uniref:Uncharacterized protein n=1 Tax=Avena sativa TaxID=4498 RepID=A0ACD6ACG1_AVESA
MEEAALWDVLAKAANIAQLSGLHAAMLVAVATSLIWNLSSRQECAKLEQCARELRALLQWPTGCVIVIQQRTKMAELVNKALRDADGLVEWYNGSTLWCRVRTGRSMVAQFRDTQSRISSYCGLMLVIHGHLLIQPMNPLSSEPNTTMIHQVDGPSQSVQAVTQCPTGAELPQKDDTCISQEGSTVEPGREIMPHIAISLHDIV